MDKIKAYLQENPDKYFSLLVKEMTDYAIFLMTTEGVIASWNEGAELIKGYKEEEVIGVHYRILFPERYQKLQKPEKELAEALKTGRFVNKDWRRRKNGEEFWARVILIPLYDKNEKLLGLAKITQDLSKEKETQEKLKKQATEIQHAKEFSEAILDTINEGIVVVGKDLRITEVNTAFLQMFNLRSRPLGKSLYTINPGWEQPELKKLLERMISKEVYFRDKEIEFVINGEKKIFRNTSRFIHHNHNNDLKILLTLNDITLMKETERVKSDFASFVSHELRTPITNIRAYVQLIEKCHKENSKCDYERYLSKTLLFTERLNGLVNELHEFNKAGADKIQIEKKDFNLEELINDNIETIEMTFPDVKVEKIGKTDLTINADPIRITQVLTNYITNAIKYSDGKKVTVKSLKDNENVIIEVSDEGKGIPEENLKKLFSRYYRAANINSL